MSSNLPQPINIGGFRLAFRKVPVEGRFYFAPRGVARNDRNKCWQIRLVRNDKTVFQGNYADQTLGGVELSLRAAMKDLMAFLKRQEQLSRDMSLTGSDKSVIICPDLRMFWAVINHNPNLQFSVYVQALSKSKAVYCGSASKLTNARIVEAARKALWVLENMKSGVLTPEQALKMPVEQLGMVPVDQAVQAINRDDVKRVIAYGSRLEAEHGAVRAAIKEAKAEERRRAREEKLAEQLA